MEKINTRAIYAIVIFTILFICMSFTSISLIKYYEEYYFSYSTRLWMLLFFEYTTLASGFYIAYLLIKVINSKHQSDLDLK